MKHDGVVGGSFRDPAGSVFRRDGSIYRQVNAQGRQDILLLESSGLYGDLTEARLLVRHTSADVKPPNPSHAWRVIEPEQIPFVSYPYEWSFGQLKDAALLTLDVQQAALRRSMVLKDASAFNVQFLRGRPILIDTLSLTAYEPGMPWVAYRQFCEHFLAPLMLIALVDPWLGKLSSLTADGVPLGTASRILRRRSWLRPSALLHVHLHARSVEHFGGRGVPQRVTRRGMSRKAMENLVEGLRAAVNGLSWKPSGTEWAEYESAHGYRSAAMQSKKDIVAEALQRLMPARVWDLGANTGDFSRLATAVGASVVAIDADPAVVETNYRRCRSDSEPGIHPLWVDFRNPSPPLGWAGIERDSLLARADADCTLALALIHHLAITANVPIPNIVAWLARLAPQLIIEFVPKDDPQVQRLLISREDVFPSYTRERFESVLSTHFEIVLSKRIAGTNRTIYVGARRPT